VHIPFASSLGIVLTEMRERERSLSLSYVLVD
jgi:hypothetical protein